jgi:hypothetical protein
MLPRCNGLGARSSNQLRVPVLLSAIPKKFPRTNPLGRNESVPIRAETRGIAEIRTG